MPSARVNSKTAFQEGSGQEQCPAMLSVQSRSPHLSERMRRLSPAQLECLQLASEHLTSKEIAKRLGISRHTVDQRLRKSIHVLQVRSRREAARLIMCEVEWHAAEIASMAQHGEAAVGACVPSSAAGHWRIPSSARWPMSLAAGLRAVFRSMSNVARTGRGTRSSRREAQDI